MLQPYRLFWQPGCSSCLKAKEFLKEHGIAFDSVNVLTDESGMIALRKLGAQSVPVVSRGDKFVFAQSLSALADFIGVGLNAPVLAVADLVQRVERVLVVASSHARQLSREMNGTKLPGRDRTYLDLAYHIFVVVEAYLIAARGGELTFDLFERRSPKEMSDGLAVAGFGERIKRDFHQWWMQTGEGCDFSANLKTYYGSQSVRELLERTAWHAAQHTRQLAAVLENLNVELEDRLIEADFQGLPLPDEVYDDQVRLEGKSA